MKSLLDRFFNPSSYHSDAVSSAAHGELDEISNSFLIIRLCLALSKKTLGDADLVVTRLLLNQPVGYELFQLTTARMIIARNKNDKAAFMQALDAWLKGRAETPANWDDKILVEAAFQIWLAEVDPDKLKPIKVEPEKTSEEDLSFVKNADTIPLKAIFENLEWLRQMNINDAPEDMAKTYRLVHFNRDLREAGFSSDKGFPDFTAALDENGNFIGSFLDH
jgi:hypothetical protein